MTKRFSKLKKQIDSLFEPSLKMAFCCYAFPMRTKGYAQNSIPRFCLKMGKKVIWDYPKDFEIKGIDYGYWAGDNGISDLVREYIDAPVDGLLECKFVDETKEYNIGILEHKPFTVTYSLTDLFKAADRRLGKDKLMAWALMLENPIVLRILIERYQLRQILPTYKLSFREMSILGMEAISRQEPVTLEEARAQVLWLKTRNRTDKEALDIMKKYFKDIKDHENN